MNKRMSLVAAILYLLPVSAHATQVQDDTKMALSGFSVSESFNIEDRQSFDIQESNLIKLVYRLWQTSLVNLEKYSEYTSDVTWEKMLADPPGFRLQVFSNTGRVKAVERIRLPNTDEEPKVVYRVAGVTNNGERFHVVSLHCPAAWVTAAELDEPMSFFGFLYGTIQIPSSPALANTDETQIVPLFLAKQLFWFPTETHAEMGINSSHVSLARHGVDIAGLDFVRQEDRKTLGTKDARTFYQFLEAVDNIIEPPADVIDHMDLLKNPSGSYGRRVVFRARVKKCSIVRPPRRDLGTEASIDHYYQLIVFPDLRDSQGEPTTVEIGKGDEKLTYRRFPFTVCCRGLPNGLTAQQIENQQILIDGFYFRFWQFEAERTRDAGVGAQISPIIIANIPTMVESTMGQLRIFFNSLLLIVFAALAIVCFTMYRVMRRQRKTNLELPAQIDVEELKKL